MTQLKTKKIPVVIHVQTAERAHEIIKVCKRKHRFIMAIINPDKPEDISNIKKELNIDIESYNTTNTRKSKGKNYVQRNNDS